MAMKVKKEKVSLFTHLFSLPENQLPQKALEFRKFFVELQLMEGKIGILEMVYRILDGGGFWEYVASQKTSLKRKRMENNLIKFIAIVRDFQREGIFSSVRDFLAYLDKILTSESEEEEAGLGLSESEAVKVMTIHKANGLEFPVVFLPYLKYRSFRFEGKTDFTRENGLIWFGDFKDDQVRAEFLERRKLEEKNAHRAEEIRKYYVAITRAQELLVLTGSAQIGTGENRLMKDFADILYMHPALGEVGEIGLWREIFDRWLAQGKGKPFSLGGETLQPIDLPEFLRSLELLSNFLSQPAEAVSEKPDKEEIYSLQDLENFSFCPRKFFLSRKLNLPPEPACINYGTILGTLIHRVIRIFHESGGEQANPEGRFENLTNILDRLLPLHPILPEKFIKLARTVLKNYSFSEISSVTPCLMEAEVNLRLNAPSGPFLLKGFADRVDRFGMEIKIYDFKIRAYSEKVHESYSKQMALYLSAASQGVLGELGSLNYPDISIVYLSALGVKIMPSEPDLQTFENWAIDTVESIRKTPRLPPMRKGECGRCGFLSFCLRN